MLREFIFRGSPQPSEQTVFVQDITGETGGGKRQASLQKAPGPRRPETQNEGPFAGMEGL
jgi:hypothetical protein